MSASPITLRELNTMTEAIENRAGVMTPREIVQELDKHIVGQTDAKRAVAIALRNRWRRMQLDESMRAEITPKNILMIGPTGVGKTEIARRLAKLADAPFIKVEATKFTEVGYVGRDVESIIKDLVEVAVKQAREKAVDRARPKAEVAAEERVLDILLPRPQNAHEEDPGAQVNKAAEHGKARQIFRKKLREGQLDDKEIEVELQAPKTSVQIMAPPGMEEMTDQLQSMFSSMAGRNGPKRHRMKVGEAYRKLVDEEAARLVNEDELKAEAVTSAEQNGIVFIDEIDKVARRSDTMGADISREGVQRDLLPLIEGCTVTTKYGMVKTDHILFIASGAFHLSKPSDLVPELQGRLPIRVELAALSVEDFERILTEPNCSLTEQYAALLKTEGVDMTFCKDGVHRIAEIAYRVNEQVENIGARRLHTLLERLVEEVSFEAPDHAGSSQSVDATYVDERLKELAQDDDLSRYIL